MQTNQTTSPVSTNQSNETELTGDPEKGKKIKNLRKVCIKVFFYHRLQKISTNDWYLYYCCYTPQQCLIVLLCCRRATLPFSEKNVSHVL